MQERSFLERGTSILISSSSLPCCSMQEWTYAAVWMRSNAENAESSENTQHLCCAHFYSIFSPRHHRGAIFNSPSFKKQQLWSLQPLHGQLMISYHTAVLHSHAALSVCPPACCCMWCVITVISVTPPVSGNTFSCITRHASVALTTHGCNWDMTARVFIFFKKKTYSA